MYIQIDVGKFDLKSIIDAIQTHTCLDRGEGKVSVCVGNAVSR